MGEICMSNFMQEVLLPCFGLEMPLDLHRSGRFIGLDGDFSGCLAEPLPPFTSGAENIGRKQVLNLARLLYVLLNR